MISCFNFNYLLNNKENNSNYNCITQESRERNSLSNKVKWSINFRHSKKAMIVNIIINSLHFILLLLEKGRNHSLFIYS